jgi:hypothetical protein
MKGISKGYRMLLDNKAQGRVGDVLAEGIRKDAQLSIISSLFSIYGFAAMKKELARIKGLRFLLPLDDTNQEQPTNLPGLAGTQADRRFRNALNLTQIARECALWLGQRAEVRGVTLPVPQNLFHIVNPNGDAVAIHGSSTFTSAGLGFVPSARYEMNSCVTSPTETASLLGWFDSIWANAEATRDIKEPGAYAAGGLCRHADG